MSNLSNKVGEMVSMYESGALLKDIAAKLDCSPETVSRHLKKSGVDVSNHKLKLDHKAVVEFYLKTKSLKETAAHFGVAQSSIRPIILKSEGSSNLRSKNWDRSNDSKIVELYNSGLAAEEIGEMFGFCHTTIFRHLQRLGVARRKTSNRVYDGVSQNFMNRLRSRSEKKGLDFNITRKYLNDLFIRQEGKCKISGVEITLPKNWTDLSTGAANASLDRIDSSKGYVKRNVQWVHKIVNQMKWDSDTSEFLDWCKTIASHNS